MIFNGFNGRIEVIPAILNAFRFLASTAINVHTFLDDLTDEETIAVRIFEQLLMFLVYMDFLQTFKHLHLHLKGN